MLDYEFVPAVQKNSDRLMIMLHGLGDSAAGYRWLPEALGLAEMNYLLVNAPDDYYGGYSWFDLAGPMLPGIARSRTLLFELLDAQRARGFPTEQTTLGGFSQGCLMALEAGLRYPRRFAGVLGISGFLCEPEKLLAEKSPLAAQQRFLVTHGTHDSMIRFEMAEEQMKLLQAAGLNLKFRPFEKDHTIAGEEELSVLRSFVRNGYAAQADPARV